VALTERRAGTLRRQIGPGVKFGLDPWRLMGDSRRQLDACAGHTPSAMSRNSVALTIEARQALLLNQRSLGELLGLSRRTIQRWDARQAEPSTHDLARIAVAVHPRDSALAARLAAEAGTTLERLGLVAPTPPPTDALPTPAAASPPHLVDVVVCAAAEAMNVAPPAVRPALLAAFRRAREVGLSVEDVERSLSAVVERPAHGRKPKSRAP